MNSLRPHRIDGPVVCVRLGQALRVDPRETMAAAPSVRRAVPMERGLDSMEVEAAATVVAARPSAFQSTRAADRVDVEAALLGDLDAFPRLFRRHRERAYWIAFQLLGNVEDARDVAQEAFLRVHRSLDRFDAARPFPAWLYRIVTNLAIDRHRRSRRLRTVPLPAAARTTLDARDDGPPEVLHREETRRRVREVLHELPPKYRTALVLRELEGFPIEEIAQIARTTPTAMRWRVHRARCLFREQWEAMHRRTGT